MSRLIIAALAVVVFLSGCARVTVKVASAPVGGSRADGTITLAYEYLAVVTPEVDWEEMQKQAQERCARWGYLTADRFGGELRNCIEPDRNGCWRWRVSIEYQCQTPNQPGQRSRGPWCLLRSGSYKQGVVKPMKTEIQHDGGSLLEWSDPISSEKV